MEVRSGVPEDRQFEIYQSSTGPVAVTNAVRRQILQALAERDLELGDLVELTGKAKPTLSNLHMRELLSQGLIDEYPHPKDARRKLYRLAGRRIGSSDLPLDELRGAVKEYAKRVIPMSVVPLAAALRAIASAPDAPVAMLRAQARALGASALGLPSIATVNDALTALTAMWARENVARALVVDFERGQAEVQLDAALGGVSAMAGAAVLAGLLEGVLAARLPTVMTTVRERTKKGGRVTLTVQA